MFCLGISIVSKRTIIKKLVQAPDITVDTRWTAQVNPQMFGWILDIEDIRLYKKCTPVNPDQPLEYLCNETYPVTQKICPRCFKARRQCQQKLETHYNFTLIFARDSVDSELVKIQCFKKRMDIFSKKDDIGPQLSTETPENYLKRQFEHFWTTSQKINLVYWIKTDLEGEERNIFHDIIYLSEDEE